MSNKELVDEQLSDLKQWLADRHINPKQLHHDFSDALSVAKLLKTIFPKLVDLHNYPSSTNTQLKVENWQKLNSKVLRKLGLQQCKSNLEKIAVGTPGTIEYLLYDIMSQERSLNKPNKYQEDESVNDEVMTINVLKKVGDEIIEVPQKIISYSIYEQIVEDSKRKDSFLADAEKKIIHLQQVLKLTSDRVEELCSQLALVAVSNLRQQED